MDFGISTRCFGTAALTLERLERLRRAEFTHLELHASLPGFNYANRSVVRDVVRWFGENEIPSPSLHLPFEHDALASKKSSTVPIDSGTLCFCPASKAKRRDET